MAEFDANLGPQMEDGMADHDRRKPLELQKLIGPSVVSFVFVLLTQSALALVSLLFSSSNIFFQLPFSALILVGVAGFGRWTRRLIGIRASAPAFVFFNIFFVWGFYAAVVRQAVSNCVNILLTGQFILLLTGLINMLSSDPGFVSHNLPYSEENPRNSGSVVDDFDEAFPSTPIDRGHRARFCKICKRLVKGFDHHCPAFGNCIGDKNHRLFIILLTGFVSTEATYVVCLSQSFFVNDSSGTNFQLLDNAILENSLSRAVATGTYIFSILQLLWQVIFLLWHIYCICVNIRTDEWINWKKYPEFQVLINSQPGQSYRETKFVNPYSNGVLSNVKEFLVPKQ